MRRSSAPDTNCVTTGSAPLAANASKSLCLISLKRRRGVERRGTATAGPVSVIESVLGEDFGVRHEGDEREEHEEAYGVHLRLDLRVRSPSGCGLEPEEEEAASVERGERQEVE